MKQLTIKVPDESHRKLKTIAAISGKTMTDIIVEWIDAEAKRMNIPEQKQLQLPVPGQE